MAGQLIAGLRRAAAALALIAALAGPIAGAVAADSAVVIMYHRFGETAYPATNTTLAQLDAHIAAIEAGGYSVLPLPYIVDALRRGAALPDKTIAITIDDAYASAYREAWPRLDAAGYPFTLFVATDAVDQGFGGMMTWDQIRELDQAGTTIGHHGAAHGHMAFADAAANAADIDRATQRFIAELGAMPGLFAYPYGEYSAALRDAVAATGFAAAFGQHSGALHGGANFHALPRFALNERYGDIERFRDVTRSLALAVTDVIPDDPLLGPNPPTFGFTVAAGLDGLDRLGCYASGQGAVALERDGRRIDVRLVAPFPPGRSRVNCTLPGPDGRWRWFSMQFVVPPE